MEHHDNSQTLSADHGVSFLNVSKKRSSPCVERECSPLFVEEFEAKRQKVDGDPVEPLHSDSVEESVQLFDGDSIQNELDDDGNDEPEEDTPAQTYESLPLTEDDQEEMTEEIDQAVINILVEQTRLRTFADEHPDLLQSLPTFKQDVEIVLQTPTEKPVTIAVVGPTGIGKSTLISALFEMVNITQSSGLGRAVTSTKIVFAENKDESCECKAVFEFISETELREIIETVYHSFIDGVAADEAENGPIDMAVAYSGRSKTDLAALIPKPIMKETDEHSEEASRMLFTETVLSWGPEKLLGQTQEFPYDTWQAMRDDVRQKVSASARKDAVWWPILSSVQLLLKHDLVKRGLRLTDTPGLGDENAARCRTALSAINESTASVLATPAVRANSGKEHLNAMQRAVARVHTEGRLHTIILVCTQSDQMRVKQIANDLGSSEITTLKAELDEARKNYEDLKNAVQGAEQDLRDFQEQIDSCNKDAPRWKGKLKNKNKITPPKDLMVTIKYKEPLDKARIEAILEKLKEIKEDHLSKRNILSKELIPRRDELQKLQTKYHNLKHKFNSDTFEARNKHIADEQVDLLISCIKQQEELSAKQMIDVYGRSDFVSTLNDDEYWQRLRAQLYPSMVAAQAHLELSDGDRNEGSVVKNRSQTGIDGLALRLKAVNLVEQLAHVRALRVKLDLVLNTLKDAVSNRNTGAGESILSRDEFSARLHDLPESFRGTVQTARLNIRKGFKMEYLDHEEKLLSRCLNAATVRMRIFAGPFGYDEDQTRLDGLYVAEYRAACVSTRRGVYEGKTKCVNFNDTVGAPIRKYASNSFRNVFTPTTKSSRSKTAAAALTKCQKELMEIVDQRYGEFKQLAREVQMNEKSLQFLNKQIQLRKTDIENTFRTAKKDMTEVHAKAIPCVEKDARAAYAQGYQRAYEQTQSGKGSRKRAIGVLESALDEGGVVKQTMESLKDRVQKNYTAVVEHLLNQLIRTAGSMRQDYSQALHTQEAGFLKIADQRAVKSLRQQFRDSGHDDISDDEDEEGDTVKVKYEGAGDNLTYLC